MESRKITIVATNVQKKYILNSTAETLGELKSELREAGISYNDMTFMEGLTRTEMKDDNSLLPVNVKRIDRATGTETTTNELVFMLTNTAKKIKSGVINRAEVYDIIKSKNLQESCIRRYGKNFTKCTTSDLLILINELNAKTTAKTATASKAKKSAASPNQTPVEYADIKARETIEALTWALYNNDIIDWKERDNILNIINRNDKLTSPYSDEEIDEMFKGIE